MNKDEAKALWDRYLKGEVSATEKDIIESWYNQTLAEHPSPQEIDWNAVEERLESRLSFVPSTKTKKYILSRYAAAIAAVLALVVGIVVYLRSPAVKRIPKELANELIVPGGNKAILKLADGREVILSEEQSGIVVGQGLTYTDGSEVAGMKDGDFKDLEIHVPRGGTYKIILADGTRVWLNADTKLKSHFNRENQSRELELEGEAYFEVAHLYRQQGGQKTAVPFRVTTAGHTINVLGTSFNVTAYQGEPDRTTLVEGNVEIDLPNGQGKQYLKPNQQAVIWNSKIAVTSVDVSNYTAWKEGTFNFSDDNLEGILRQVSRWYDVDVRFRQENLKQLKFEGIVPRYEQLTTLLKALEKAGDVEFEFNDRLLIVKRK